MSKEEFMEYTKYLNKTLNIEIPKDKEVLAAWYEPFKNTHLIIAKNMAQLYLQRESGIFKLAKLLEYKSAAMKGKNHYEQPGHKCDICDGTGFVEFEVQPENYPMPIFMCRRCICPVGNSLPKYVRQTSEAELNLLKEG